MSTLALVLGLFVTASENPSAQAEGTITGPAPVSTRGLDTVTDSEPRLKFFGYSNLGFSFIIPPTSGQLVGSNNGFRLAAVRLGTQIKAAEKMDIVASIEGSVARRSELDALSGSRFVELRDVFARWTPTATFNLRGGQFKPPFNAETLLPDALLPFTSRSIVSQGILPPDGLPQEGLSLDRQVGIEASSERLGQTLGFRYAVGVFNGNGQNVLFNDNSSFMPVARLVADVSQKVNLGLAAYYNPMTLGLRPNQVTEDRLGWDLDLSLNLGGLNAMAMLIGRRTTYSTPALPADNAWGWMGSVRYLHEKSGFDFGLRVARLDPSRAQYSDMLTELTGMVGYWFASVPLRVIVQYSVRREEPTVSIPNNGIDALAQVQF